MVGQMPIVLLREDNEGVLSVVVQLLHSQISRRCLLSRLIVVGVTDSALVLLPDFSVGPQALARFSDSILIVWLSSQGQGKSAQLPTVRPVTPLINRHILQSV